MTLSQGEVQELDFWQERLSTLLRRQVSLGETVGILTRICTARYNRIPDAEKYVNLADLVEQMVD
jgi:hypothetical protein